MLDSINGYLNALPEERFLAAHLHELLAFLSEKGVATILTLAQHGSSARGRPSTSATSRTRWFCSGTSRRPAR